jgi:hypothetical protein
VANRASNATLLAKIWSGKGTDAYGENDDKESVMGMMREEEEKLMKIEGAQV